jgi:hypothetical protein
MLGDSVQILRVRPQLASDSALVFNSNLVTLLCVSPYIYSGQNLAQNTNKAVTHTRGLLLLRNLRAITRILQPGPTPLVLLQQQHHSRDHVPTPLDCYKSKPGLHAPCVARKAMLLPSCQQQQQPSLLISSKLG